MEMETWKCGDIDMETWRYRAMDKWRHGEMETWRHGDIKQKMEALAILLDLFTNMLIMQTEVVVCPFVDKETNGSYQIANGLAHLCIYILFYVNINRTYQISTSTVLFVPCVSQCTLENEHN